MPHRPTRHEHRQPAANGRRPPDPHDDAYQESAPGVPIPRGVLALQHAAGNRAVGTALHRAATERATARPLQVQRWAWVAGTRVRPSHTGLGPAMVALAGDRLVHDYLSMDEFRDHAAGRTDTIGNLPGPVSLGTWVRFAPNGLNLLGEDHTRVTLEQVLRAVGSRNFIYEPFSTDVMPPASAMNAAYQQENAARFGQFGVGGVADKRQFGGESLFPKMGYSLNLLLDNLDPATHFNALKRGLYTGQPLQRYLKIAWAHGSDVAAESAALTDRQRRRKPAEWRALAAAFAATQATLAPFITPLPVDGYLGEALDTVNGRNAVPALRQFCTAFVAAMVNRARTDTGLTRLERLRLTFMRRRTREQQEAVFAKWRNLHFAHAVRDAARRGVRYAGMGAYHLNYLRDHRGVPAGSSFYYMTGLAGPSALDAFEDETRARRDEARRMP